jgi:hypothetical protein
MRHSGSGGGVTGVGGVPPLPLGAATEATLAIIEADLVPNVAYVSGAVAVTTTQAEAKVGATPLANRITLTIENKGTAVIFVGPTGVTSTSGLRIMRNQVRDFVVGPGISVFMITASGAATAIVQEMS